jgi:hypothetical protein
VSNKLTPYIYCWGKIKIRICVNEKYENHRNGQSFMIPDVGHDVVNWLGVSGNLAAHRKAIETIKSGFGLDKCFTMAPASRELDQH